MSFRTISYCSSLLFGTLSIQLIRAPEKLWVHLAHADLLGPGLYYGGRRSACLFLGMATITFSLRNLPLQSEFRPGYCLSMASWLLAVAALGAWELVAASNAIMPAPTTILGPVVVEVALGAAFLYHSGYGSRNRKKDDFQKQ